MRLVRNLSPARAAWVRFVVAASTAGALLFACGGADDTSGSGGGRSSPPGSSGPGTAATDCPARCSAKAAECSAPASVAGQACGQLCSLSPTAEQLDCIEATSCSELAHPQAGLCGIGASSSAGPSGGATSGATSGGVSSYLQFGDSCTCSGGADLCQSTAGPCEPELTCVLGVCAGDMCDQGGTACPSGASCTLFVKDGVELGWWCAPG